MGEISPLTNFFIPYYCLVIAYYNLILLATAGNNNFSFSRGIIIK